MIIVDSSDPVGPAEVLYQQVGETGAREQMTPTVQLSQPARLCFSTPLLLPCCAGRNNSRHTRGNARTCTRCSRFTRQCTVRCARGASSAPRQSPCGCTWTSSRRWQPCASRCVRVCVCAAACAAAAALLQQLCTWAVMRHSRGTPTRHATPPHHTTTQQVFAGGSVCYGYTTIPTYPSGQIGMMVCCKGRRLDARVPRQPPPGPVPQLGIGPLRCVLAPGELCGCLRCSCVDA